MRLARAERPWRLVFGAVGVAALVLQYVLMVAGHADAFIARTVNFFSFFTILTNILVTAAFVIPAVAPRGPLWRWADSEGVRAATTMYAVVVGLVYHFLLASSWSPQGWDWVANFALHYVMPLAMLLDWMLFTPKGRLRWIDPVKWLAFPLVYGGWTALHGLVTHWWPYGFVNVDRLGWTAALIWYAGLLAFFLAVGLIVSSLDRRLGRDRTPDPA